MIFAQYTIRLNPNPRSCWWRMSDMNRKQLAGKISFYLITNTHTHTPKKGGEKKAMIVCFFELLYMYLDLSSVRSDRGGSSISRKAKHVQIIQLFLIADVSESNLMHTKP